MQQILKYPRTRHLVGSALQEGDEDLEQVPFSELRGRTVVYEEKLDGANCGFFFDGTGDVHAQSRGHELDMSAKIWDERHFNPLKDWLSSRAHQDAFLERIGDRYIVYGEWMYASHSVYYDLLPAWFNEFDIFDKERGVFLDTPSRRELLSGLPIASVPILYRGPAISLDHLKSFIGRSIYKSENWRESFAEEIRRQKLDPDRTSVRIEDADLSEGIYGKIEENGEVLLRFKMVRHGFIQKVSDGTGHWKSKPIVPNVTAPGFDMSAPGITFMFLPDGSLSPYGIAYIRSELPITPVISDGVIEATCDEIANRMSWASVVGQVSDQDGWVIKESHSWLLTPDGVIIDPFIERISENCLALPLQGGIAVIPPSHPAAAFYEAKRLGVKP